MKVQITEFGVGAKDGLQLWDKPFVFTVRDNDESLLGRLHVNRHSVEWWPCNAKQGIHKSWPEFAALIAEK